MPVLRWASRHSRSVVGTIDPGAGLAGGVATSLKNEFAHIERQHRRLSECVAEVKRLNKMVRGLLEKYHETKEARLRINSEPN